MTTGTDRIDSLRSWPPQIPVRRRRWPFAVAGALLLAAAVFFLGPALLSAMRPDALPGVTVLDVRVGGLSGAELEQALEELAERRRSEDVAVRRELPEGRQTGSAEQLDTPAAQVGYEFDVQATADAARQPGRESSPAAAWRAHLRAFRAQPVVVAPVERVDEAQMGRWAEDIAAALSLDPIEGDVAFVDNEVSTTFPEPGAAVDVAALIEAAGLAVSEPGPATIQAQLEPVLPETTAAAVEGAAALAEQALSGPVALSRNDGVVELSPEAIADIVSFEREAGEITAVASEEALAGLVDDEQRAALERAPVDAEIALENGAIRISESSEGFSFDPSKAAAQVLALATSQGPREAELEGEVLAPARSSQDAEALQIREEIASFTTQYTPSQSRNTNIQLMADMVHGAVLEPGEEFSVNDHVGRRTEEKGFVGGGAILEGEFVEQIGGGVSQFATTLYNAAYFGGYEILQHQAHSYYIDRYPAGREATLNYPNIDVRIRNNSPYGMLIATSHDDSSVTVSIWATPWVEVESEAGERTRIRRGEVRDGFDIVVDRILRFPDGRVEREQQFTRYFPED